MVVTPYLPHSRVGHGGGSAVRDLVKHLAAGHEILLVSLVRPGEHSFIADVENLGVKVAPLPFADSGSRGEDRLKLLINRFSAFMRSAVSGYPFYVEKYWIRNISRQIRTLADEFKPDAIQIEYLQMSLYARDLTRMYLFSETDGPRIILNSHELGSVPRERRAARAAGPFARWWFCREASRWKRLQVAACKWTNRMLCVTEEDRRIFEDMGGINLLTVPLGMDLEAVQPHRHRTDPPTCLFVGTFNHRPNVQAADLLIHQIWPQVRALRPEVQLILVGRGSQEHLQTCKGSTEGISAVGFVDDLTPLFSRCALFVAPLPEGGGIKIKILEAMARGIPVLTTPVGAEGITTQDDQTIFIIDPVDGFASAVVQALDDPLSEKRARKARLHMEKKFGWKAIAARLEKIYRGEE